MQARDVMNKQPIVISATDTIAKAGQIMREKNIGCLVVTNAGAVQGILTDRDIAVRCVGANEDPKTCQVGKHMTSAVVTATPQTDLLEAAHLMTEKQVKRLPIVEGSRLMGVVSMSDIARAMDRPMHDLLMGMGAARRAA